MSRLTLALDIMGGDLGPHVILDAAKNALQHYPQLQINICGTKATIEKWYESLSLELSERVILSPCEQVVTMDERPTSALRNKKESSMYRALELVDQQQADACVSAGNTGALLAMAYCLLKTLPGIDRPALISSLPTIGSQKTYLLDLGANVNCDSEVLFQYAVMGSVLAQEVANIERPRVALLNVGEEQIKGNDIVKQTATILAQTPSINYIGYIEGNDIFAEKADVIVTDGFVGNIALKSCEGLAQLVLDEVKKATQQNLFTKILAKIALPLLHKIYLRVNPDQYNGASLIGLRGIVVKSHGNASTEAFLYAIHEAVREVTMQVPNKIKNKLEAVLMERPE